ncbi:hypothetical protein SAMN05428985_11039 [Nocardioides sp. YR527]|nr:hypothetical protein SAMN05428985_11039 [Nocardioides sp. YR527]
MAAPPRRPKGLLTFKGSLWNALTSGQLEKAVAQTRKNAKRAGSKHTRKKR